MCNESCKLQKEDFEQWSTYGYLNFTLANSKILLIVDVHSLKSIFLAIASLHQKHYRKSAWIIDKEVKKKNIHEQSLIGAAKLNSLCRTMQTFCEDFFNNH